MINANINHHENTNHINIHSQLGNTKEKTGFWIDEFATPYYVLADAGATISMAYPAGGQHPVDPKSEASDTQSVAT